MNLNGKPGPKSTNALWVAEAQIADFLASKPELELTAEYAGEEDDCTQGWKFFFTGTPENLERFVTCNYTVREKLENFTKRGV